MRNPFITDLHFVAGVSRVFKLLNFEIPEGGFGFECLESTTLWFDFVETCFLQKNSFGFFMSF